MKKYISILLALALLLAGSALAAARPVGLMQVGSTFALDKLLRGYSADLFSWESSDASVALVKGGVLGGVGEGTAVITASAGGKSARFGVVVLPASVSLKRGETHSLPGGRLLKYAAEDTRVARVSDGGVIGGVAAGSTRIGVKYGRQTMFIQVNVTDDSLTPSVTPTPTPAPTPDAEPDTNDVSNLDCAATAEQIVLVRYQSGSKAELSVHQKTDGVWDELFSCPAYVGKNGIGKTREGDKKTPSGTYNLSQPFGIKDDPGAKLPYTKVTEDLYWCGTSSSPYYNRLVSARQTGRAATASDEKLINYKGVYNYALFIDYNVDGVADKGSCIFLHCTGSAKSTAGCIAVDEAVMKQLIQWVRPGCKIVIM